VKKSTAIRFIPLAAVVILAGVFYGLGFFDWFDFAYLKSQKQTLSSFVERHPLSAPALFILTYSLAVLLSIPGAVFLTLMGGFLFAQPFSTLYVTLGAGLGASALFLVARLSLGKSLEKAFKKKAGKKLKKMEKGFKNNAASYLLFLRFIPLFPFWLVNLAPAFLGVRFSTYVWTTFVGIIPGVFVYTQLGRGLGAGLEAKQLSFAAVFNVHMQIALVLFALFSLVPIGVKYWRRKKIKR